MPVIGDLRNTISARAGQFQGQNSPLSSPVEKTRFQVAAELEALGKVGATQAKLWNSPWTRVLREKARRICREGYSREWPGGREVHEFRERLKMRGFPVELLKMVDFDGITANQAVGGGSGAARIGRMESLRELAPEYDAEGRYNLTRDLTAATLGGDYDAANRYAPPRPGTRPPIDAQVADMENSLIELSKEPTIEVNQDHFVHLDKHIPLIGKQLESLEQGQAELGDIIEPMVIAYDHSTLHLEQIQGSVVMQEQVAQYRKLLQNLGAMVVNMQRKYLAEQQRAMEQAQEEGAEQGQVDPGLQEKAIEGRLRIEQMFQEHGAKMEMDAESHAQDMRQRQQKFAQEAAMKDANTAAQLLVNTRKQLADVEISKKKQDDALEIGKLKRAQQAQAKIRKSTKSK